MKSEKPLRITRLTSENVKRLSCVTIEPDGSLVVVGGQNGSGKSSALDSIAMALGGKALIPSKPIRKGQKSARITVDLGEFIVERRFTEAGSNLYVRSPEGANYPSPQAMLDKLCSKLSFDPLEFSRKKPAEQLAALKGLVNLDFSALDANRKKLYDERTFVNREADQLRARLDGLVVDEDAPDEEVKLSDLLAELNRRRQWNDANDKLRAEEAGLEKSVETVADQLEDIDRQMRELQSAKAKLTEDKAVYESALATKRDEIAELTDEDTAEVENQIESAEAINAAVRLKQQARKLTDERKSKLTRSEDLTAQIDGIDEEKTRQFAEAKFPVDGLGFDEDGVTLNGLPFEQASSAERLRVSVAMGFALNPRLKVLLIRDGSLLDENGMAMLAKMAEEAGGQLWLEVVGNRKDCTVILEDGHVQGDQSGDTNGEAGGEGANTELEPEEAEMF